ncbi:T9SS type A sorting domain-containing protein [Formosa maritima]|nr:T9SS type A sorting domain-containing protein [Formosa maritima]
MKNIYFTALFCFIACVSYSQEYQLGIVHISEYNFKIVSIPDFDSTGNTDMSDVGFTLVLPAGAIDVTNHTSLLAGRTWSAQEYDATFLSGLGLGDGTKDVFQFNMPPGQSILSHTNGQHIDLVSFSITSSPVSGNMYFLLNTDPIAVGALGVLDSFYNSNIDGTTTQDYFSIPAPELNNFMFSTLNVEQVILEDNTITVYPNPVSNYINIATTNHIQKVDIFDILGKKVKQESRSNKINVNHLQAGIYLVKVITDKGQITKKIVIE